MEVLNVYVHCDEKRISSDDEAEEDADKNSSHRGEVPLGLRTNVEIFCSNIHQSRTWKAKTVRARTIPVVIPAAMTTASTS